MAGGGDPNNAMAGASGAAQAFGYNQNVSPSSSSGQPMWMQGLMGALTGSQKYGQNAPQIHQALQPFLQGMSQQHPQAPAMMGARPQMGAQAPTAFPGLAPQMPQSAPFGQQQQIQPIAPWAMGRM